MFKVQDVSFSYGKQTVLSQVNLEITPGKITTLLGPNGSGKSTLLSLLANNKQPREGTIWLDHQLIHQIKGRAFAKRVATLHQNNEVPAEVTVGELVAYGRMPYKNRWQSLSQIDKKQIQWALEETGLTPYAHRRLSDLSGGWRQLAFIAMALAQDTPMLILDEPTTFLDLKYQLNILQLIRKLNRVYHKTIVMVLHDLNHAMTFSDEIIGLKAGGVILMPQKVADVTPDMLDQLYEVKLELIQHGNQKILLTGNGG
ncbi:MAG: ABC transporter ATP-binding protein [Defluviitaleaceae bacterium]|nr:ABC transporter ATP-binding protein [Defluviitaleaceae bacterium]